MQLQHLSVVTAECEGLLEAALSLQEILADPRHLSKCMSLGHLVAGCSTLQLTGFAVSILVIRSICQQISCVKHCLVTSMA